MSERRARAEAVAWKRYPSQKAHAGHRLAFVSGTAWADNKPHSTPEDLVRAYEDGQRDAAEKGAARARITRARMLDLAYDGAIYRDGGMDEARLRAHFKAAGIEVVDDE